MVAEDNNTIAAFASDGWGGWVRDELRPSIRREKFDVKGWKVVEGSAQVCWMAVSETKNDLGQITHLENWETLKTIKALMDKNFILTYVNGQYGGQLING